CANFPRELRMALRRRHPKLNAENIRKSFRGCMTRQPDEHRNTAEEQPQYVGHDAKLLSSYKWRTVRTTRRHVSRSTHGLDHPYVRRLFKPVCMAGIDERDPIFDANTGVLVFFSAGVDHSGVLRENRRLHDRVERQDRDADDCFFLRPLMGSIAVNG